MQKVAVVLAVASIVTAPSAILLVDSSCLDFCSAIRHKSFIYKLSKFIAFMLIVTDCSYNRSRLLESFVMQISITGNEPVEDCTLCLWSGEFLLQSSVLFPWLEMSIKGNNDDSVGCEHGHV